LTATKAKHVLLVAGFVLIIYGVPVAQMLIEAQQGERPQIADIFTQPPTPSNLKALEKEIEQASWFAQNLRPWARYLQFVALRDCGDKGLIGKDGWFFYAPAVQYLVEPASPLHDVDSTVVDFRDQLAQRGIKLLVICAPNKASVYPEMLTQRANDLKDPVNPLTREILLQLRNADVEVLDLFEIFGEAKKEQMLYLAQDSHWSAAGAELAAKKAAERLVELGWVQKGTTPYKYRPLLLTRLGDILQMMRVPRVDTTYPRERINCTQVLNADSGRPYTDDPNSDILVLGDSFLRIYQQDEPGSAGFISHLAYQLASPVASLVNDGGASTLVRQQLYRKPALLAGRKVVIWEFVERDIRFGTEGWQKVPLPDQAGPEH
jgi:lysophospholipase L1-like esterase